MHLIKHKTLLLLLTSGLLTAGATTTINFARLPSGVENVTATTTSPHSTIEAQGQEGLADEAPSNIQVVLLALRSEGFEPTEIQLPAGEYLLVVRNRTGVEEVNVRLFRGTDQQLKEARVGSKRNDWKQRIHFEPGTYVLTETAHPEWTGRIVVER